MIAMTSNWKNDYSPQNVTTQQINGHVKEKLTGLGCRI